MNKEKIEKRQSANLELIQNLQNYIEKYPNLRFGQILIIGSFIANDNTSTFYEEPVDVLQRLKKL